MRELTQVWGKLIGGLIGMSLAGPLGAVAGLILGHSIDVGLASVSSTSSSSSSSSSSSDPHSHHAQQVFFEKTFVIMGYVAKAGGRITEQHISNARVVMVQLGLNDVKRREAIRLFNCGKSISSSNCRALCLVLRRQLGGLSPFLRLFLDIQFNVALVGGLPFSLSTEEALRTVWTALGFDYSSWCRAQEQDKSKHDQENSYERFRQNNYQQQQQGYEHQHQRQHQQGYQRQARESGSQFSLQIAYEILNLKGHEKDEEVKRAYRKLISQYHPDKLMAQGETMNRIKLATEKTQCIQKAYETVCQERERHAKSMNSER